jgi:hypothetical protein
MVSKSRRFSTKVKLTVIVNEALKRGFNKCITIVGPVYTVLTWNLYNSAFSIAGRVPVCQLHVYRSSMTAQIWRERIRGTLFTQIWAVLPSDLRYSFKVWFVRLLKPVPAVWWRALIKGSTFPRNPFRSAEPVCGAKDLQRFCCSSIIQGVYTTSRHT